MDELNYIITKAKAQIDHLERRTPSGIESGRLLLEYLRVIRDAVYTKDQINET